MKTTMEGFKLFLEGYFNLNGITFLENPSKMQLAGFAKKVKTQRKNSGDLRGIFGLGNSVFYWDAMDATHYQGAEILGLPYNYLERINVFIDAYGQVHVSSEMEDHPQMKRLELEDGIL